MLNPVRKQSGGCCIQERCAGCAAGRSPVDPLPLPSLRAAFLTFARGLPGTLGWLQPEANRLQRLLLSPVEQPGHDRAEENRSQEKPLRDGHADQPHQYEASGNQNSSQLRIHLHDTPDARMTIGFAVLHRSIVSPMPEKIQPVMETRPISHIASSSYNSAFSSLFRFRQEPQQ